MNLTPATLHFVSLEHASFDSTSVLASRSQLNLSGNYIGAEGAKPLADALRVEGSLTRLNVEYNDLGDEGRAIISSAVQGKVDFDLSLRGQYE